MEPLLSELSSDPDLRSVGGLYTAGGDRLPLVPPHPASLGKNTSWRIQIAYISSTPRCGTPSRTPGASLTAREKLEIAHQLARLKVDIIEAGFPVSSNEDF